MKDWAVKFVTDHGTRLIFMTLASAFGYVFFSQMGLEAEGKTILTLVAGIAVNQCRSAKKE